MLTLRQRQHLLTGMEPVLEVAEGAASAEDLPLFTTNPDDFTGLEDLLTLVPVTRRLRPS
jgi:hypothetical protein